MFSEFLGNSDYAQLHGHQILVRPGVRRTCFTIVIVNDLLVEGNETFTISLDEPVGGLRSGIRINPDINGTVLRIIDNDSELK